MARPTGYAALREAAASAIMRAHAAAASAGGAGLRERMQDALAALAEAAAAAAPSGSAASLDRAARCVRQALDDLGEGRDLAEIAVFLQQARTDLRSWPAPSGEPPRTGSTRVRNGGRAGVG